LLAVVFTYLIDGKVV